MTKSKLQTCKRCGVGFHNKRVREYCGRSCYFKHLEENKQYYDCMQCGKSVYKVPKDAARSKGLHFCSRQCSGAYQTKENHHAYKPEAHPNCETCGKQIKRPNLVRFCSTKCYGIGNRAEKHAKYVRLKVDCTACGKSMERIPALIHKTNFCSSECQNGYHSERLKGTANPRYKHGDCLDYKKNKALYAGFTLKLRKAIRKRDDNMCAVCYMTYEEHKMNMHVHHIDYDKTNNHPDNLICLCRYCHMKVHGDEKKWQWILSVRSPA